MHKNLYSVYKRRREDMELKILILDDEYIILDGLCSFPWSDYGY